MLQLDNRQRAQVGRAAVAGLATYEVVALFTKAPTLTCIIQRALCHKWARIAVWLWAGFMIDHFWGELPVADTLGDT